MSKRVLKTIVPVGLLFGFAVGCAHTNTQTAPVYSDVPTRSVTPTSDQQPARVYSGNTSITPTVAPSGVAADDWTLNENLRALLTGDRKLVPPPSEVTAVVDQKERGVVHLSGHISNQKARQRLLDAVGKLPGVTRVDDHMTVGAYQPTGAVDLKAPP